MAITQVSQLQIRRGLQQDLPQLASGEFGWSIDSQRLYIGNGTLAEGAPSQGVTEILTQYSNFFSSTIKYTFAGTQSGYTSQTGLSPTTPIQQALQDVLDQSISVKDFGAKGDGVTDDTLAINRAIQQVYYSALNGTHLNIQRTIKFPAGKYIVTGTILIPPNCHIVGDGKNNSLVYSSSATPFTTCDSLYQIGGSLGTNSAILPSFITIRDLALQAPTSTTVASITSGNSITFNRVQFIGGTYSVTISGSSNAIKLFDCAFTGYLTGPVNNLTTSNCVITKSNSYDTTQVALSIGSTTITSLANGSGEIKYQLADTGGNYRFGTIKYNASNSVCVFDDSFTEPSVSLGANLYIYANGAATCSVTSASTLKYNLTQFI